MILKNKIKKIIDAIEDTSINSIEISSFWGAQKIKLTKGSKNQKFELKNAQNKNLYVDDTEKPNIESELSTDLSNENITTDQSISKTSDNDTLMEIKAPLIGTFYLSPKPGEPQFINIGDTIIPGQTLCIIEAMKIFNEIESEYSGKIVDILINDGDPVEYDQPLFTFKPE